MIRRRLAAAASLVALLGAGAATAKTAPDPALRRAVEADYRENLAELFDHFHRNPELSGLEVKTAARMAQEMRALGYEVTEGVGRTGVVGVMRNGDGPTILIRADMDGLPVREQSGLANASTATQTDIDGQEKPVMHACGHDVHITSLIGTARQLAARKDRWAGTVVLVAQPAEERGNGANWMVEDGLYSRFPKPDYAIAFHVAADLAAGQVSVPTRVVSSSADSIDIAVHGVGTHGAYPHLGVDPVLVASQIVVSLQSITSREINPLEGAVITVGSIHGGIKHNIIGDRVDMQLTVRADDPAVRLELIEGIRRVSRGTAIALGVPDDKLPEVTVPDDYTPAVLNDPETAGRVRQAIAGRLGADRVVEAPRTGMGAEDFSFFVMPETGVKGVYFDVGGTPEAHLADAAGHHSPLFKIEPEAAVTTGVEATVAAVEGLLPRA